MAKKEKPNPILVCGDDTCYHRNEDGSCRCKVVRLVYTHYPSLATSDKSFWCDMHIEKWLVGKGASCSEGMIDEIAARQEAT